LDVTRATYNSARDAVAELILSRVSRNFPAMDAHLAAAEMIDAAFDAIDPDGAWRQLLKANDTRTADR
jgi:hypothetical protein